MKFILSSIIAVCLIPFSLRAAEEVGQFSPGAQKQGFYAALETGGIYFTGNDRSEFSDGWVVGVKLGYDLWKYLGVEGFFKFSGHESNIRTVTTGVTPSFFAYQAGGMLTGAYPVMRRLFVGGGLGGGIFFSNPNHKPTRASSGSGMFTAQLTAEYFMRTRGVSIGFSPSLSGVQNHKSMVLQSTGYLRYSF